MLWFPACARFSFGDERRICREFTVTSKRLPLTGLAVGWQVGVALGLLLVGSGLLVTKGIRGGRCRAEPLLHGGQQGLGVPKVAVCAASG
jgi:hypothetical protein